MYGGFGAAGIPGAGVGPVGTAAREARYAMDTLGVPSFGDIWNKVSSLGAGGFGGVREFGNMGAAATGADFAKKEVGDWKKGIAGARSEYANPTGSPAFRAEMGLASERTAAASEEAARNAQEAAQRRGYAGGYDPRQSDIDRMRALSEAGFAGVKDIRDQALQRFGTEEQGYGAALGSYTDLTKTQAELPTKWLSALSPILSSALGAFGGGSSYFHDALMADQSQRDYNRMVRGEANAPLRPGAVGTVYRQA